MGDHEVRAEALGDVQDLGAHLHARRRHGEHLELEALALRQILEHLDGLPARRVVVEEVRDLLALQAAAELLLGEVDGRGALRPVRGRDGEDVRIADAVGGGGAAEARRGAGDLVFRQLRGERVDLRRAVDGHGDGALLLVALVGLDGRRHLVLVVDLERLDLAPLDPALAVHEREVVVHPGTEDSAHDLGRPRPIALHADDDLVLGRRRRDGPERPPSRRRGAANAPMRNCRMSDSPFFA